MCGNKNEALTLQFSCVLGVNAIFPFVSNTHHIRFYSWGQRSRSYTHSANPKIKVASLIFLFSLDPI